MGLLGLAGNRKMVKCAKFRRGKDAVHEVQQLAKAGTVASIMATEGPHALRSLTAAIAETGDCREQETLYRHVLPSLHSPAAARIHVIGRVSALLPR